MGVLNWGLHWDRDGMPGVGRCLSRTGEDRSPTPPLVGVLNWDPESVGVPNRSSNSGADSGGR